MDIDSLRIGGVKYSVSFVKDYARDFNMLGSHCGNSSEINIDNGLSRERTEKTLLHEALEAINFEYELDLEHCKLTVLETALYAMIKDNEKLMKILTGGNRNEYVNDDVRSSKIGKDDMDKRE